MCGICGQFNFARNEPVEPATIRRMTGTIVHRGPDDEGYFISGPVGLGFRRLSIIDLAGGHQPMSDAEETVWVIFNGEIYNYKELRAELQAKGHQFRTNSDTEVIIHGYKEWGTDVFNRLNGMFGLAIWDVPNERLVLNLFLRFRYTPSPLTIFQGIRKLAPGTMLVFERGGYREERWYNYTPVPFSNPKEDKEATKELLELYRRAVRRHLLSDVPVGILLSGGLDSGLLLALMNEQGGPWPAYTIGYGEKFEDDELADAKETAALLGARHIPVKLDRAAFERSLPKIVECLEEPISTSSIVPMYFVSQRARHDVKVALIGQGPDELFGGYKRHLGVRYGNLWRRLPTALRSVVGFAVHGLPRNETLKRGAHSLGLENRLTRYQHVFSLAPGTTIDGLFRDDLLPEKQGHELVDYWRALVPQMEHTDELGGFQLLEIRSSLPDELLMYADKLSMAHSLEVRVPYLDRTVVEYVQRLGASFKIRRGTRKWLHRRVCQSYLPLRMLKRKKRGFAANVVDGWLRSSAQDQLPELLLDESSSMFDLLKPEPVRKLLSDHRSGRHDNHKLLFSLVMIEQWLRGARSRQERLASTAPQGMHGVRLAS
jgi:asparagine synthase (glutamine-hydrolysing)